MKPPSGKGREIECPDFFGQVKQYPADSVRFRPAGYGILQHQGRILLSRSRFTGLWDFPGGGVEPFERMDEGMAREFREETGLAIVTQELIHVAEGYIAMFGHPFHSLRFYYRCRLKAVNAVNAVNAGDPGQLAPDLGELAELKWWVPSEVPRPSMHDSDREALDRFLQRPRPQ
ncbi:MAG: NUDIX domain-containing protein [Thermaerobacter sp.]|nr:NUDIX domain-containing protein [Thermaerobacter sp.]